MTRLLLRSGCCDHNDQDPPVDPDNPGADNNNPDNDERMTTPAVYRVSESKSKVKELEVFDSSDPQKLKMFFVNLALVFNDRPKYFTDQWKLQEEVHRARDRAVFVDQMIKEYPDEGYYEVILPPLSQLEGDLNKAHEDLHRIATFAHCLYRLDPVTVLHHHYHYIGVIIEAVVAFLHRGPDSDDLNAVIHYFRCSGIILFHRFPTPGPLFLPEQESPTSPSPPPPSPTLPPLFGSVVNLAIDLTGDDDELYETEESRVARVSMTGEVVDLALGQGIVKEESL
ncbi:hypothetical protein LENED_003247 [Lentinula edodes]|uniref:Uncharacterized protein n=1 Tax=Lentinula edodes TaxID=5353 RepID=A0A1Q3E336_LENED|nr:hypothetical protein LENED_003247 [Lentinula edodes]